MDQPRTAADPLAHPLLAERILFPRRHEVRDPFVIQVGDVELACVLRAPHPGGRTVVCFHGNGETVSDGVACLLHPFHGMGLNVLLATYRGYGASTGDPTLAAALDDAPEVVRALGVEPSRVILYGRSLGSLAALRAAGLIPGIAGLILESAIADLLPRVLRRVRPEEIGVSSDQLAAAVAARIQPADILAGFPKPVLILHAQNDTLVGVDNARRLHGWAAGPCRLKVFLQGDHNTLLWLNEEEYFDEIRVFVAGLDSRGDGTF